MKKIAIIAALESEVARLVKGWKATTIRAQSGHLKVFERKDAIVVCGGIGPMPARKATEAAYQHCNGEVSLFISAGFAGALQASLKVGDIVRPSEVISDADGQQVRIRQGNSVLVSAGAIASESVKKIFAAKYAADAVDMEAYSVGDVASIYKVPFVAIKAISDELSFPMPPLGRFVNDAGQLNTGSFVGYAAVRPWLWPNIFQLGKNGTKAAEALGAALENAIEHHSGSAAGLYNKEQTIGTGK